MDIGNASIANSGNKSTRNKEQWAKMLIILIIISLSIFYLCYYIYSNLLNKTKIILRHLLSPFNLFERKTFNK